MSEGARIPALSASQVSFTYEEGTRALDQVVFHADAGEFVALLASNVDLAQVWPEVAASNKRLLLLAALSHYATNPVRGVRWRRCLQHIPGRCGSARFGLLAFFFLFVDNVVPAKLGDIYVSHLARINCGVRRSAALGSIVFQRMMDVWMVLFLAAA